MEMLSRYCAALAIGMVIVACTKNPLGEYESAATDWMTCRDSRTFRAQCDDIENRLKVTRLEALRDGIPEEKLSLTREIVLANAKAQKKNSKESPYELLVLSYAFTLARNKPFDWVTGKSGDLFKGDDFGPLHSCNELQSAGVTEHLKARLCDKRESSDVLFNEAEGVRLDSRRLVCNGLVTSAYEEEWKQECERFGYLPEEKLPF